MIPLLLSLSILLSAGRNLLSKALSSIRFGSRTFFICQSVLFLFGSLSILFFGGIRWSALAWQMWLYALGYGVLLICAQWFYTAALSTGNTALCSTVYSMGFILPTISGALIWAEPFTLPEALGFFVPFRR